MRVKAIILVVMIAVAGNLSAQKTLKEALYGGRLKSDTGSVVRKTDDLASKIDTTTRVKPEEPVRKVEVTKADGTKDSVVVETVNGEVVVPAAPIDNNKVWKTFVTDFTNTLKAEVLTSPKVKKGNYAVLVEYEIGTNGEIHVIAVSSDPKSDYIEDQVKSRMTYDAPKLNPLIVNGKPKAITKKQMLILPK